MPAFDDVKLNLWAVETYLMNIGMACLCYNIECQLSSIRRNLVVHFNLCTYSFLIVQTLKVLMVCAKYSFLTSNAI